LVEVFAMPSGIVTPGNYVEPNDRDDRDYRNVLQRLKRGI
jgi:hypothetical protein